MSGRKTAREAGVGGGVRSEGLHAHKKIGRNEERVFTAGEKPMKVAEKQPTFERDEPGFGRKRGFN